MAFSLMVPERITIFIRSLTVFTCKDSFDLAVRVSCMSSGIILIVELFSTLSATEPTSSFQNLAAKSYNFRLVYVKNFVSNIYYINFIHYCTKTVLIILSFYKCLGYYNHVLLIRIYLIFSKSMLNTTMCYQ